VQNISFKQYKDARDSNFSTYLKEPWSEYVSSQVFKLYEKQKPKSLSSTFQKKLKPVGPPISILLKKDDENQTIYRMPNKDKKDIEFIFFGQDVGFNIDMMYNSAKYYPQNQIGITNFFSVIASSDYEDLLTELKNTISTLKLNDWGVYQLVIQLSKQIYTSSDDSKLFTWFILSKMGYDIKIGLSQKHIVLMHYSKNIVYSKTNFIFDEKKYYVLNEYDNEFIDKVYTYETHYPGANKDLDFSLKVLPNFKKDIRKKTVSFRQYSKDYKVTYRYDKNLIDFMITYPQVDYEIYFNAPLSSMTLNDIVLSLKKYIDNQKASRSINFVLHFVQKSFKYERDLEQFSKEKVMFAQETLYFDKSDCEDRVILFSALIKRLFHFSVVGIKYKDHMSAGLYIPMRGDSVRAYGRRFVIADPTYINANIGQSMSKYKNKTPESFILVK
jgi:hypothetical protein